MRGLKIQGRWVKLILDGQKTMEVRGQKYKVVGQRIALGNSDTKKVEGYATVEKVIEISYFDVPKYHSQHHATGWLMSQWWKGSFYGYVLKDVKKEPSPFLYRKSPSIWFNISSEGTP